MFLYYVAAPWNLLGKIDPIGAEAGYEQVAARAQAALDETGATWIATTDYRTYAMMRWLFRGRVPVIEINERGRFQEFADPGMDRIKGHAGIYIGRQPDDRAPVWDAIPAKREHLGQVERRWRGLVIDTYAIEKLSGWTPELSPPKDSPLFWWKVLAGSSRNESSHSSTLDHSIVGWAKRSVPTSFVEYWKDGGHGALRLCPPYGIKAADSATPHPPSSATDPSPDPIASAAAAPRKAVAL
ncbi:hypothetical protein ACU4GH_21315 [Bradyrhizobium betae]